MLLRSAVEIRISARLARGLFLFVLLGWIGSANTALAQQKFSALVGPITVQPVQNVTPIPVPFLTWGGDVATFYANGGLKTTSDSINGKLELDLQLRPGDDFVGQVRDYLTGKTPFLRGTMRMLGQASEVIGSDPRTKPVVILQLSWSAGDHIVALEQFKTLNDLKQPGKKVRIACQQGGPHVGLLWDSLDAAQIKRDEIDIVWVKDLTGPDGPADALRNGKADACCVITPDLIGLTGGLDSVGSGAEGTVKGAHLVNSTQQMSRSIADVYAVRSDWYKNNRAVVEKFVAGYLKATEEVVQMRKQFETSNRLTPEYQELLTMAQKIFGEDVLPTLEVDAHGLLLDCSFVGLPGQVAFFEDQGNLNGFEPKMSKALDLATGWGYADNRFGFEPARLDYRDTAKIAGLKYVNPGSTGGRIAETYDFDPDDELDDKTIVSFTINFEPNQSHFSADQYGSEFNRAIQAASTFGNAVVVVRGHSDPTQTLRELIKAGEEKGMIKVAGTKGNRKYFLQGKPLNVDSIATITQLIATGQFEGTQFRPRETMQAAMNLSFARAKAVTDSLEKFAKSLKVNFDASQIHPVGAGISEPLVPKPTSLAQAKENMRVEFRIVKVPAEAIEASDFDF